MHSPVLSQISRKAMATDFVVMLPGTFGPQAEAAVDALALVEILENQLSIYRPDSYIARLNRASGRDPVSVSPDTTEVLLKAIDLSHQTAGAFDVTAGPLVEAWGFSQRNGRKPSQQVIREALSRVGFDKLRVDPLHQTAELLEPGMSVNLGAIGKGYALDRIAACLRDAGIHDFLVHGGQSSVIASGDDGSGDASGWRVAIQHPLSPKRIGGLVLVNEALGTSGSGKQFFHHRGQRLGHVIDPRNGWPAGESLSMTVICASATEADALATGLFVLGKDHPIQKPQIGLVAVLPATKEAGIQIHRTGLRENAWIHESFEQETDSVPDG